MTEETKRAEGVEFKRENRYIVIKRKRLSEVDELALLDLIADRDMEHSECVVVESDWPEYETVWAMIEARVTGRTPPAVAQGEVVEIARLQARVDGLEALVRQSAGWFAEYEYNHEEKAKLAGDDPNEYEARRIKARVNGERAEYLRQALTTPQPDSALVEAAKDVLDAKSSQYKARNGRMCSIEDDNGEMCFIVPHDEMIALEAALKTGGA